MYCEDLLQEHSLLPGTSCTTAIRGDNPLEEGPEGSTKLGMSVVWQPPT